MKQKMKRWTSALLALVMVAGMLPFMSTTAHAAGNIVEYDIPGGTIKFDKDTGTITGRTGDFSSVIIPATIEGVAVTSIGEEAFRHCMFLGSVTIPGSVKHIGNGAFEDCSRLTSVTIENGVTSIGKEAFNSCGLKSVTIPNSVTSIGFWAFSYCTGLESVTIGDSVTSIEDPFFGCSKLTDINVVAGNSNYSSINGVLFNKDKTELILYPAGKTAASYTIPNSVTSIGGGAFARCSSLTSVTIPNSVTSIGSRAFEDCTSLTSITIPNSVTSIGSRAFEGTAYYKDKAKWDNGVLYIGKWLIEAKTSISSVFIREGTTGIASGAFYNCSNLTSVTIPNSVTSIGEDAFSGCTSLESVTGGDSVTSIGSGAFKDCSNLTSVTIPNSVTSIGGFAFYNCSSLTSVTIPNSVTSIGNKAFYNCSSLTSVTGGDSVTSIGEDAFAETPYFNNYNGGVMYIGKVLVKADPSIISGAYSIKDGTTGIASRAFYNCSNLTSVTIPNSVTSIGERAFSGCTGLKSVTIGDSVTSIGSSAFYNCSKMTDINVVAGNSNYSSINGVLFNKDKTELILYPAGKTATSYTIPNSVTIIGSRAFYKCSSLTSVTIPNGVISIGYEAFYICSSLTSVTIPDSVTIIGGSAFGGCRSFTSVTIPDSVTIIGSKAFSDCNSMTDVMIGKGVTSIEYGAFSGCNSMTDVHYAGSEEQWKRISIDLNNNPLHRATKHFNTATYPLWIGGEQVTGVKLSGTEWSYDPAAKTLTLTNASITGAPDPSSSIYTEGICFDGDITDHLTLVLEGDSTVTGIAADGFSYGIFCAGPLTITGTGSLTVTGGEGGQGSFAIEARKLVLEDGTVTATGGVVTQQENPQSFGLAGAPDGITIKGGTVTAAGQTNAFNCDPVIQYANLQVTVSANPSGSGAAPWKAGDGDLGGDDSTFKYVKIAPPGGVTPGEGYIVGDVDGNGTVNKADSILLDRYVANWIGYADKVNMDAADVNRDGNVNKADAILLARYVANWPIESQIGQTVEVGAP